MEAEAIRILLIEDNPDEVTLLCEELSDAGIDRFEFECVERLSKGLENLKRGNFDVILLDLSLPDSQGFDTFTRVYSHAPKVPIVVLSRINDEALAIKTVRSGAQDYLVKEKLDDVDALVRSIHYAIERQKIIDELRSTLLVSKHTDLNNMKGEIEVLRKHKGFFLNYKSTFTKNFTKVYSELNLDVTPNDEIKDIIANLYDSFFPFEVKENGDYDVGSKFLSIKEKGIDVKPIMLGNFFVMTRDFINGLSPKENNIISLRYLANIIERYMNILDTVYYEESGKISTKDISVEKDSEGYRTMIKGFKFLEKEGKEVKLVNFYKGILIRYDASLLKVDEDEIIFQVHKYQRLALEEEKRTLIKSDIFPKLVSARLVSIDKTELKATLVDFVYVESSPEKRMYMRIQPKDPLKVVLYGENYKIEGQLTDISIASIAVYVTKPRKFRKNSDVGLHILLPNINQRTFMEVKLHGKIISIYEEKDVCKLVIDLLPEPYAEPLISQYISQRQVEILRTMKLSCG
jgi:DNA-binding NarL/FixJ family response regulator